MRIERLCFYMRLPVRSCVEAKETHTFPPGLVLQPCVNNADTFPLTQGDVTCDAETLYLETEKEGHLWWFVIAAFSPAEAYPFTAPYTAEEMGYRMMEFTQPSRVLYWLETHSFYPLRTETYDREGNLSRVEVRLTKMVHKELGERGYSPFIQVYWDVSTDLITYNIRDGIRLMQWSPADAFTFFSPDFMR